MRAGGIGNQFTFVRGKIDAQVFQTILITATDAVSNPRLPVQAHVGMRLPPPFCTGSRISTVGPIVFLSPFPFLFLCIGMHALFLCVHFLSLLSVRHTKGQASCAGRTIKHRKEKSFYDNIRKIKNPNFSVTILYIQQYWLRRGGRKESGFFLIPIFLEGPFREVSGRQGSKRR